MHRRAHIILALAALAAMVLTPSLISAVGFSGFEDPDIGPVLRQTINPYYDVAYGITFSALPRGQTAGEVGIVRSNASLVCIEPGDAGQVLGTATAGSGNIGNESFAIRIDLPTPAQPPVYIGVTVQTFNNALVQVTMYDPNGDVIPVPQDPGFVLVDGTCLIPGGSRRSASYYAFSQTSPVAYVVIDTDPDLVFTIDNFGCIEKLVSTAHTTWGHVKALYR